MKSLNTQSSAVYVALPDGIVIGGVWPHAIIVWRGGNSRGATKPESDLFQALEKAHTEIADLRRIVSEQKR